MAERLHIIMPCMRFEHLARIAHNFFVEMKPHPFELRWHIMAQGPEPDPYGNNKANEGIEMVRDGWLVTWSDDTIHQIDLFKRFGEVLAENPNSGVVVFGESRPDNCLLKPCPENVRPCRIDGQQLFWKREFLGDERLNYLDHGNQHDGYLAQKMYEKDPSRWVFVEDYLIRFNALMH